MEQLTLRDLLDIAKHELKDLTTVPHPDFRLEQAEYNYGKGEWEIVVSFLVENTNKRQMAIGILTSEFQFLRQYKKVIINSNKEFKGFYIFNHKE